MIPLTLAEVAQLVGGTLDATDGASVVRDVVIDSREAGPESLFVALAGERADGHDFAAAAGAGGVLAARPVGVPAVLVDDVQAALGRLAHGVLERLRATPLHGSMGVPTDRISTIGITGSAGKTTTKDLLAHLLRRLGPVVASRGSYNNELGLPLTVLRCDEETRFLVLEYGARGSGHIRALCAIARPDIAVVLNVGDAHLGGFGSRDAIAKEKAELVEAIHPEIIGRTFHGGPGGPYAGPVLSRACMAVLNADDPRVLAMRARAAEHVGVTTFGTGPDADVRAADIRLDGGRARFRLFDGAGGGPVRYDVEQQREIRGEDPGVPVAVRLVGEHQVSNALAAAAAALSLHGLDSDDVARCLSEVEPTSPHRMAVTERADGVTVVDDTYNSSPEAVRAALKALVEMTRPTGRRAVAVLGEMRELGEQTDAMHADIGELAVRLNLGLLVTVGDPATPIGRMHAGAVLEGSWGGEALHCDTLEDALALLRAELRPGDVVLVKASRTIGLDRLVDALLADSPAAPAAPA